MLRFLTILMMITLAASAAACKQLSDLVANDPVRDPSPITEAELEGTNWFLLSYGPAESPQTVLEGSEISVGFDNFEDMHGFASCNYYAKHFEIDSLQLITDELQRTRFNCSEEDVMTQDKAVLDALQTISSIGLDGDILVIGYDVGQLHFEKEPPPPITPISDTDWQLTEIVLDEEVHPVVENTSITASFQEGIMSGGSGCNSYGGEYEVDGSSFSIGEIVQTAELCLDEALMDQENTFIDILRESKQYLLEGEMLTISLSGAELRFQLAPD